MVADDHGFPEVDAFEFVAVVDLHAGAFDKVVQCQVAAPAQLGAEGAEPFFHHRDEAVGALEMVDHDDACARFGHPLGLADQAEGVADDADDVADEHVIEGAVFKRQPESVGLKDIGVIQPAFGDFLTGLLEHAAGQIQADDPATVGVIVERNAGANAEVEDAVGGFDLHVFNRPGDASLDESAKGGVVEQRMNVVDFLGAGFLHGDGFLLIVGQSIG